jgi:ribulose-phosphate 3-epimerase
MKIKISPSILSADFGKLNDEIKTVEKFANSLHIDVMDGHFVDNISYGVPIIKDIKTKLFKDCHLMITDPVKYSKDFSKYCDRIIFHAELYEHETELMNAIDKIKKLGIEVGLALNPDKPVSLIKDVLHNIDAVLIMGVYAGFGGQKFIPEVLNKVKELRRLGFRKDIIIDGGINDKTSKLAIDAGVNILVAGSYIFGHKDRKKAMMSLK